MFEIGNSLRDARNRRQLDLNQAEQGTKIRAKYLRALEDEQFDVLPGGYVKGFLGNYAEFLGLDGQVYVDEYNSRFVVDEDSAPQHRRLRAARPRPHRRIERNVVLLSLVGIAAVTALIIAAWKFGGGGQTSIPNLQEARPAKQAPRRPVPAPKRAYLFVEAVRGSSLLEVHAGSASGRLVFHGTLERGQSQRFVARRLWINVGSPENLWLRLNGRPVPVGGRCPRVLIITAKRISSSSQCS